jgi:hypothetical protein
MPKFFFKKFEKKIKTEKKFFQKILNLIFYFKKNLSTIRKYLNLLYNQKKIKVLNIFFKLLVF